MGSRIFVFGLPYENGGVFMIVVNIAEDRSLTLPKSCGLFLKKGMQFLLFQSDDEIVLKRIKDPDIKRRALTPSKRGPMTLDEISEIVHEVRRKSRKRR
jgi:hypothetical protein